MIRNMPGFHIFLTNAEAIDREYSEYMVQNLAGGAGLVDGVWVIPVLG